MDLAPAEDVTGYSCTLHEVLATEVRAGLRDLGLPQAWLASKTGFSQKHVSQMLTGKVEGTLPVWEALLAAAGRWRLPPAKDRPVAAQSDHEVSS